MLSLLYMLASVECRRGSCTMIADRIFCLSSFEFGDYVSTYFAKSA